MARRQGRHLHVSRSVQLATASCNSDHDPTDKVSGIDRVRPPECVEAQHGGQFLSQDGDQSHRRSGSVNAAGRSCSKGFTGTGAFFQHPIGLKLSQL
jgi:hypothetical protein